MNLFCRLFEHLKETLQKKITKNSLEKNIFQGCFYVNGIKNLFYSN